MTVIPSHLSVFESADSVNCSCQCLEDRREDYVAYIISEARKRFAFLKFNAIPASCNKVNTCGT